MVVRRSDARRRRIVVDPNQTSDSDSAGGSALSSKSKTKKQDVLAYSYGANRRNHHKTTDLIPKRVISYLLVVLAMVASLALLNYGAQNAHRWTSQIGAQGVGSLGIKGSGTIANWFSSFLLIMTGLASLQIYALRRHRCDDYRGTYRLWGWMAALFLFASVNCVVNLGSIFSNLLQSLTHVSFSGKPWALITIKILALSGLVGRGLYEVRESRGSLAWVVLVWLGYTAAMVLQLPESKASLVDLKPDMMVGNCVLVATVGLLMAHLTYARFIFLQAHGLIKLKVKKKKVAKPKAVKAKTKTKTKAKAKPKKKVAESTDEVEVKKKTAKKTPAKKTAKAAKSKTSKPKTDDKPELKIASKNSDLKEASVDQDESESVESAKAPAKNSSRLSLKEMAAASRAKSKANRAPKVEHEEDDEESEGIIKLSKAQRRKQRKDKRKNRRAA